MVVMRLAPGPAVEVGWGRRAGVDARGAHPQPVAADLGEAGVGAGGPMAQGGGLAVGGGGVGGQLVELLLLALLLPPPFSARGENIILCGVFLSVHFL